MTTESSSAPPWRWWRAGVFAIAMTSLAAFAHLLAGGHLPGIGAVVLGGLLVSCLTYPFAHRERPLPVVLAATATAQAILHVFFGAAMGLSATSSTAGTTLMHGTAMSPASAPGESGPAAMRSLVPIAPGMLAVHAAAAVVLAIGLRTGERAFLDLAALLRSLLEHVLAVLAPRPELASSAGYSIPAASIGATVGFAAPGLNHSIDGRAPPRTQSR